MYRVSEGEPEERGVVSLISVGCRRDCDGRGEGKGVGKEVYWPDFEEWTRGTREPEI